MQTQLYPSRSATIPLDNSPHLVCHLYKASHRRKGPLTDRKLTTADVLTLYERHSPVLVAYACSFVSDSAVAEDAVHQVFLKLLRGETKMPDIPIAYLYRAVRNTALNANRHASREQPLDQQPQWFHHKTGDRESALALQSALSSLPEDQRETVLMKIWSGLTLEEIASATGVSMNTAASRYRYALEKLRDQLQPYRTVLPGKLP